MKKKLLIYIITAVIIIASVISMTYCIVLIDKMREFNKVIAADNTLLNDKLEQLEVTLEALKKELALKEEEYQELIANSSLIDNLSLEENTSHNEELSVKCHSYLMSRRM